MAYPQVRNLDWSKIRDKNTKAFLVHVVNTLRDADVTLKLSNTKTVLVEGTIRCSGTFDEEGRELAIAIRKSPRRWLEILVHEFGHFEQWRYDMPTWREAYYRSEDASGMLDEWLNHTRKLDGRILAIVLAKTIDVEVNCERRAIEIIKRFSLPINIQRYCQRANSYLNLYNWAALRQRWCPGTKPPYSVREIVDAMPSLLQNDYHTITPELVFLYDKYYLKGGRK